jgi:hypothetical protein
MHKRKLVSSGLPVQIASENKLTLGYIFLNDKGDIIVSFEKIDSDRFDLPDYKIPQTSYLIDAKDDIIETCEKI